MSDLSGAERAAVFLMSLGDNAASSILRHVDAREMQQVTQAMNNLKKVSWGQVSEVITDFHEQVKGETAFGIKAPEFTKKVLKSTLGERHADALLERIKPDDEPPQLDALYWMDPRELASLMKDEHPQVIANVMVLLSPEGSATLLENLDEEIARQAMVRLASLTSVSASAIAELEELLRGHGQPTTKSRGAPIEIKGAKQAAGIINNTKAEMEDKLIDSIRDKSTDLAKQVEDLMFAFEDLKQLSDRDLQRLLRETPSDQLMPALKGSDISVQEKFFGAMSRRAGEMLRDDLEVAGPIKLSHVEEAHREILATARRLAEEGSISLGGKGGDEYV